MPGGLNRKPHLTDKLPQLLGYLAVRFCPCSYIVWLGRWREKKTEPDTSESMAIPLLPLPPSDFPSDPQRPLWNPRGPFFEPLPGPPFLCLSLSRLTEGQGEHLCICICKNTPDMNLNTPLMACCTTTSWSDACFSPTATCWSWSHETNFQLYFSVILKNFSFFKMSNDVLCESQKSNIDNELLPYPATCKLFQ